ncbi:MAG TPA: polymer-forming cytoskeletal protein [Verrucomicrobiae bacterium]|nr:polymer-forming cytoskeletal protein [Verrucomicrobiae bacterium]
MVALGKGLISHTFRIRGDVNANSPFDVPEGSEVEGSLEARRILVAGFVRGPVSARDGIVVLSTGILDGELKGGTIDVQEGATCKGACRVGRRSVGRSEPPPDVVPPENQKWFFQR